MQLFLRDSRGQAWSVGEVDASSTYQHWASAILSSNVSACSDAGEIINSIGTKSLVSCGGSSDSIHVTIHLPLLGGKGGFGSLLKKSKKPLTNNVDACRDHNGQRIGAVRRETMMAEWRKLKEQEGDRETESVVETEKDLEIRTRMENAKPRVLLDESYMTSITEEVERTREAFNGDHMLKRIEDTNKSSPTEAVQKDYEPPIVEDELAFLDGVSSDCEDQSENNQQEKDY
eukprot:GHVH01004762.1.p1 GENE.GHVH01004762.1~~GHVH01004762.1.p1  ORF type:complete len:231 (+),score=41.54 GHVH01004762.1:66-758(+)